MDFKIAYFRMPGRIFWRIRDEDLGRLSILPSVPARDREGCRIGKGFALCGGGFSEGSWIAFADPASPDALEYGESSPAQRASILRLVPDGDPEWDGCAGLPIFAHGKFMKALEAMGEK